ncbi:MAG: glycosyltransferase family 4 protein [Desulfitobacterium sp.]
MKKVLFCASTASHINNFHLPYLKAFHDMGYEVHVAVNEEVPLQWADKVIALPFAKSYLSFENIKAIYQALKLLKRENYEKVSIHTTLASTIIRIAALFLKDRPRIYYIVHGYLFNLDSGPKKWLYLIPEKIAASVSDIVMVMNHEDYDIAQKYKLYKYKLCTIDGMGIDPSRFKFVSAADKGMRKKELGYKEDEFLFVYAAEFSKRKNQKLLIRAFSKCKLESAHLLLAGKGKTLQECKALAQELGQMERIHFLGYVNDVPDLYTACDAVVSTSLIEGLPFNILEAIGCGLPVIASDIKGHRELIDNKGNGLLFDVKSEMNLTPSLEELYYCSADQRLCYGQAGKEKTARYCLDSVFNQIMSVYTK